MTVISAKNIVKNFGKLEVLKDVSLKINEGEVVALIGPSGSGKSTLLRSLIHLETVDGGTIAIEGETVVENGVYNKNNAFQKLGMVFQNFNLFPHKSVLENIILAPMLVNGETKDVLLTPVTVGANTDFASVLYYYQYITKRS